MPISGYQIEAEHPPIDSTIGLKMSFCKFTFKSFLPELQKKYLFHASIYTERAIYRSICLDFSVVASFPASLHGPESLEKRLVQQWASSLILSSDDYFVFVLRMNEKTMFCT